MSKIHFAEGELGVLIPKSEVPSQTKRLHPIIYGEDQLPGRIPTFDSSAVGESGQTTGKAPARSVGEDDFEASLRVSQSTATSPAIRQKKKIAPTLVKSWPDIADEGGDAVDFVKQPSTPATRNETTVETAIAGSSSPSSGSRPSEKKKRRIAPTLVCSGVTNARILDANQGIVANAEGAPEISSPSGDDAAAGDTQQERAPKRRLTPTRVSAL